MEKVKIKLPDGSEREYDKGITPLGVAKTISGRLGKESLISQIDGIFKELDTPINHDCDLHLFTFSDEKGKETYWHSSSHLMAHAVKELYPEAKFGVGPAIDNGFYYDIDINDKLSDENLVKIENKMKEIIQRNNSFKRKELSKTEATEFFTEQSDEYKLELIDGLDEESAAISIYGEGNFTDL